MQEPQIADSGETTGVTAMSLGSRMGNIFVSPSEVFDYVKVTPPTAANWVVPTIVAIVMGIIFTLVVFSQPAIVKTMHDAPFQAIEKKVSQGKLTRQQADQQIAQVEPIMDRFMTPEVFKATGIASVIFIQPGMLFLIALVIWLIGTFAFGGRFEYMKAVEVVGLSTMITIPGSIVVMLLAVIYGSLYVTPSPVLFVSHFDPTNPIHALLSSLNVVYLWYLTVLAIGLARLCGTTFIKAACWAFGLWAVLVALKIGVLLLSNFIGGK